MEQLGHLCQLLDNGGPLLLQRHRAQLHTLLGLYAMTMNLMELAETQLNAALRVSIIIVPSPPSVPPCCRSADLSRARTVDVCQSEPGHCLPAEPTGRRLHGAPPEDNTRTAPVTVAQHAGRGVLHPGATGVLRAKIQRFKVSLARLKSCVARSHHTSFHTFRRFLRETLKMANAEDLNRLTSCSLVLLGHIFLSLGNTRESMNMVTPAMQLASKIPDVHVQLWASAILKGKFLCNFLLRIL